MSIFSFSIFGYLYILSACLLALLASQNCKFVKMCYVYMNICLDIY